MTSGMLFIKHGAYINPNKNIPTRIIVRLEGSLMSSDGPIRPMLTDEIKIQITNCNFFGTFFKIIGQTNAEIKYATLKIAI